MSKEAIEQLFRVYEEDDEIKSSISSFCEEFRKDPKFRGNDKIQVQLSSKTLPMPENLNETKKNLIIFDGVVNQKDQSLQKEYYTRGRHMNCTVFYLTQNYYDVSMIIRTTVISSFSLDNLINLKHSSSMNSMLRILISSE